MCSTKECRNIKLDMMFQLGALIANRFCLVGLGGDWYFFYY